MKNFKFILVDDDRLVLTFCRLLIKKTLGEVEIHAFTEAEVALQFLKSIDLAEGDSGFILLLDINMPTMTGWEFLYQFEKLDDQVKKSILVFILSSSVDERDMDRARLDKNVTDYLIKPLAKEVLLSIVDPSPELKTAGMK